MAGGILRFDPLAEIRDMVASNCADLSYRADAVTMGLEAGLENQTEPERLPVNIYGTDGDWEDYSTPSRDARLKTAFKELRDDAERFLGLYRAHDPAPQSIRAAIWRATCRRSMTAQPRGLHRLLCPAATARAFPSAMKRQGGGCSACPSILINVWSCAGARKVTNLRPAADGAVKQAWYAAEQGLRNQIDRTYEAKMDWSLRELQSGDPAIGAGQPPDTDTRAYLLAQKEKPDGRISDARFHQEK